MSSWLRLALVSFLLNWLLYFIVFGVVTVVVILVVVPVISLLKHGVFQLIPLASMIVAGKAAVSSSGAIAVGMAIWTLVGVFRDVRKL